MLTIMAQHVYTASQDIGENENSRYSTAVLSPRIALHNLIKGRCKASTIDTTFVFNIIASIIKGERYELGTGEHRELIKRAR